MKTKIETYARELGEAAHQVGSHGLTEREFFDSGIFRGAIERIRGQFSATMMEKRRFASAILDYMVETGHIVAWRSAGEANRHDYEVDLKSGRIAAIELKGCLDGNNTNIFERPANANEFVIWSVCTNAGADPRHNVWSGLHTRLSAEIVARGQQVDGVIVWDMVCGTVGRPCPKLEASPERTNSVGAWSLPPPCLYVFPGTVPTPRQNPEPAAQALSEVELLSAFHGCYQGRDDEVNYVRIEVRHHEGDVQRRTTVSRGNSVQKTTEFTSIRRT